MKHKLMLLGIAILSAVCIISCKDSSGYGYVTGKVFIDGEPAQRGLIVRFHPQSPGASYSTGVTDENGRYEMNFSLTKKGVQVGLNKITLEFPQGDDLPKTPEFLNKYNESPLTYEVKSGRQSYDIKIEKNKK